MERRALSDGEESYEMERRGAIRSKGEERSYEMEKGSPRVELALFLSALPSRRVTRTSRVAPSRRLSSTSLAAPTSSRRLSGTNRMDGS